MGEGGKKRHEDTLETVYSFLDSILVVCPRCEACGQVSPTPDEAPNVFSQRRLVCPSCGLIKHSEPEPNPQFDWNGVPARDGYFGLPLWLQTSCCGENLWALNQRHLALLESYVGAKLRSQNADRMQNSTLVNRLPVWMKLAKNRTAVLKAIQRMRSPNFP